MNWSWRTSSCSFKHMMVLKDHHVCIGIPTPHGVGIPMVIYLLGPDGPNRYETYWSWRTSTKWPVPYNLVLTDQVVNTHHTTDVVWCVVITVGPDGPTVMVIPWLVLTDQSWCIPYQVLTDLIRYGYTPWSWRTKVYGFAHFEFDLRFFNSSCSRMLVLTD